MTFGHRIRIDMKKPLIIRILEMCGVQDLDGINHVTIDVTPSKFNVHIQQNAYTADGKLIIGDQDVVQKFRDFELVEVKDENRFRGIF